MARLPRPHVGDWIETAEEIAVVVKEDSGGRFKVLNLETHRAHRQPLGRIQRIVHLCGLAPREIV